MKQRKTIFLTILSLGVIFLVSSSMVNYSNSFALIEINNEQVNLNFEDRMNWRWTTPEVVSTESTGWSYRPDIAVDSTGSIHIVWNDQTDYDSSDSDWDIFYKNWNPITETWSTTVVISTESITNTDHPDVEVDNAGNIHIIWDDLSTYGGSGVDQDIYYKQWTASNSSWGDSLVVSTESTSASKEPSLCIDSSGNAQIVWKDSTNYDLSGSDYDIFYKKWVASSESFTTTEVVSIISSAYSSYVDTTVDSNDNVYVVWRDETFRTDGDILYRKWDSSSSLWQSTELLTFGADYTNLEPVIEADNDGNTHVIWRAGSSVFYRSKLHEDTDWTATEIINIGSEAKPELAIDDNNNLYLACESGNKISFMYKDSESFSWSAGQIVSIAESTQDIGHHAITADNLGHVHLVWYDETDYLSSGIDRDILYRKFIGPPEIPRLAEIVPYVIESSSVNLFWDDSYGATTYYIYRSTLPIWSVEGLTPVDFTIDTDYIDSLPSEDTFYFAVVAGNFAGNSSVSNYVYVEYNLPEPIPLQAPELAFIIPNPSENANIFLDWDDVDGATEYYLYRSSFYIWSVEGLSPIDTTGTSSYIDSLPSEGTYFYVIVATDGITNSTHSNCWYVYYAIPHLREFTITTSVLASLAIIVIVFTKFKKKKG